MMSFSILAARADGASGEASSTNNSAFARVSGPGMQLRAQSVHVHGDHMHDAGSNEHEKQRHVQYVPYGKKLLVNPELDDLPRDLHPPRDVVERNALEPV